MVRGEPPAPYDALARAAIPAARHLTQKHSLRESCHSSGISPTQPPRPSRPPRFKAVDLCRHRFARQLVVSEVSPTAPAGARLIGGGAQPPAQQLVATLLVETAVGTGPA